MKRIYILLFAVLLLAFAFGCAEEIKDTSESEKDTSTVDNNASSDNSKNESSLESNASSAASDSVSSDVSCESSTESSEDISDSVPDDDSSVPTDDEQDNSTDTSDDVSDTSSEDPEDPPVDPEDPPADPEDPPADPEDPPADPEDPPADPDDPYDIGDAEVLPSGHLIYNGAAYCRTYYSEGDSQNYADVYAAYAKRFPNVRISAVSHPLSAINITNPAVRELINDQGIILDRMESHIYGNVNFVNLKDIFIEHRGEYLFFKSDYHWTQLGAYYAYYEFAKSIGITPTALSEFEKITVTDSFVGRIYDYAHDDRILSYIDTVYAYMPTKSHTMKVYNTYGGDEIASYDNCIRTSRESYSCFLTGDQPFSVINVPENDQEKAVLVIKESSGNAFVPFLTEHYGNIIVVDPRHTNVSVSEIVEDFGVDDIIFFANASTSNSYAYCNYYWGMLY